MDHLPSSALTLAIHGLVTYLAQQVSDDCVSFVADVYTVASAGNLGEIGIGVGSIQAPVTEPEGLRAQLG